MYICPHIPIYTHIYAYIHIYTDTHTRPFLPVYFFIFFIHIDNNEKKDPTMNVFPQHPAIGIDDLLYFLHNPKTFVLLMSTVLATGQTDLFRSVLDRVPEASLLDLPKQKIVVWITTAIILKDEELVRCILQKFCLHHLMTIDLIEHVGKDFVLDGWERNKFEFVRFFV